MKALGRRARGARLERMQASPQWDGGKFSNAALRSLDNPRAPMPLGEFLCPSQRRTPLEPLPVVDPTAAWRRPADSGLRVTWLGHSTVLLELGGRRILTDPVWGERASPVRAVGPKRFQPVPVALTALPQVDLILLSHDHYDHLDYRTIRTLAESSVPFVAPLGVGTHLEAWGVEASRITEVDWWETVRPFDDELVITSTPAQHFSGRSPTTSNHTLWSSYVVAQGDSRVYVGGDSGLMTAFADIGAQFGPFDLVMLEVGAYHPAWANIHLGPMNALAAHAALGGGPLLPIHWGTFDLSTHRWDQPIETAWTHAAASGVHLLTPRLGEPIEPVLAPQQGAPWWRAIAALHGPSEPGGSDEVGTPPPPSD
ncbi:MAG: MBL fold metallo-hydrolase [Gemmatimonadales bacterium]